MENKSNKKKILFVLPAFPVATETFIQRDIAEMQKSDKLAVDVFTLQEGNGVLDSNLKKVVHTARLSLSDALNSMFSIVFQPGPFFRLLKTYPRNFYLILKAFGYSKKIEALRPDELHVHFLSDFSTLIMIVADILRVPFSISAHARDVTEYPHLPELKSKRAKFISVCNKNAYEYLLKLCPENVNKIHLINHYVSPEVLQIGGKYSYESDVPVIFMGGTRLAEKKGIKYMIKASKILSDKGIPHKVVVMGPDDGMGADLNALIAKYNLKDRFMIKIGAVPFDEVLNMYNSTDLFVLPNIKADTGDVDGIPNVLIEAALSSLPIITTDAGSNTDLIEDNVTGFLVNQADPENLASKIESVLTASSEDLEKIGNAAKERAENMFSRENTVLKLESLLLENPS